MVKVNTSGNTCDFEEKRKISDAAPEKCAVASLVFTARRRARLSGFSTPGMEHGSLLRIWRHGSWASRSRKGNADPDYGSVSGSRTLGTETRLGSCVPRDWDTAG